MYYGGNMKYSELKDTTRGFISFLMAQAFFIFLVIMLADCGIWKYIVIAYAAFVRMIAVDEKTGEKLIIGPLWLIWTYKPEPEPEPGE